MANESRRPIPRHPSAGNLPGGPRHVDRPNPLVGGDAAPVSVAARPNVGADSPPKSPNRGGSKAARPADGRGDAPVRPTTDDERRATPPTQNGKKDGGQMSSESTGFWLNFPEHGEPHPSMEFGPDLDNAWLRRLLGTVSGKVVLELGCGTGARAVWLAQNGAKVIAVDSSSDHIESARRLAEAHGVAVEFHHGDLAEIPFVRAERVDVALSVYALSRTAELGRVFRQVHRVLHQDAPLVISLPHPTALQCRLDSGLPSVTRRSDDPTPVRWEVAGDPEAGGSVVPHRSTDVFVALRSSNFRVDTLLEPMTPAGSGTARSPYWSPLFEWLPSTLIVRGRKEGT